MGKGTAEAGEDMRAKEPNLCDSGIPRKKIILHESYFCAK